MRKLFWILIAAPQIACASSINNPTTIPTSLPTSLPLPGAATNYLNVPSTGTIPSPFGVSGGTHTTSDGSATAPAHSFVADLLSGMFRTAYTAVTSAASTYNTSTNAINVANNYVRYQSGQFTTSGSLPSGLSAGTTYYVIPVDSTHFKVASSLGNAQFSTAVSLGTQGTGNHTFTPTWTSALDFSASGYNNFHMNGSTVYIGPSHSAITQEAQEALHVEGNHGGSTYPTTVDNVVSNIGHGGARYICSEGGTDLSGVNTYFGCNGSESIGSFWTNGPSPASAGYTAYQNATSGVVIYSITSSSWTYFWNDASANGKVVWDWSYGSPNTGVFRITESSVTSNNNVVLGSTATISGGAGFNTIFISTYSQVTSTATTGTGSFQKTNIIVTVTPHSTRSWFELDFTGLLDTTNNNAFCDLNIYRNDTTQLNGTSGQVTFNSSLTGTTFLPAKASAIDAPNTLASTTYRVFFNNSGSGGTCALCGGGYQCLLVAKEYVR